MTHCLKCVGAWSNWSMIMEECDTWLFEPPLCDRHWAEICLDEQIDEALMRIKNAERRR